MEPATHQDGGCDNPETCAGAFACDLQAIPDAERPRHNELARRVRAALLRRSEIDNGYTYALDATLVTSDEVNEWIALERLCCPFLTFALTAPGDGADCLLTITGPKGVRPLLDAEFPVT